MAKPKASSRIRKRVYWLRRHGRVARGRHAMGRISADQALRRGSIDGLLVSVVMAVFVVLTNGVFPGGPQESDADPEYRMQYVITLTVLAVLLVVIGAHGRHSARESRAGIVAGTKAGAVLGLAGAAVHRGRRDVSVR